MKRNRITVTLASIAFVWLVAVSGCILNPEKEFNPPPIKEIDWKPLTEKENCIYNLKLAYDNYNSPEAGQKYEELLHSDYIWYMQEDGEYFLRDEDVTATKRIFENAILLTLELHGTTWDPVPELGGETCVDCWEASREYEIVAQFSSTGKRYAGHDLVKFIVVPEGTDANKKYKIFLAYDINNF
jgi:hypothetical protein